MVYGHCVVLSRGDVALFDKSLHPAESSAASSRQGKLGIARRDAALGDAGPTAGKVAADLLQGLFSLLWRQVVRSKMPNNACSEEATKVCREGICNVVHR